MKVYIVLEPAVLILEKLLVVFFILVVFKLFLESLVFFL